MTTKLKNLKKQIPVVLDRLESTLEAAASQIRNINKPNSANYADAVLCQNDFDHNITEIYLPHYAPDSLPKQDTDEFRALMSNLEERANYEKDCYESWKDQIMDIDKIIQKYKGSIQINTSPIAGSKKEFESLPLVDYLNKVSISGNIPNYRISVIISIPEQEILLRLREFMKVLG